MCRYTADRIIDFEPFKKSTCGTCQHGADCTNKKSFPWASEGTDSWAEHKGQGFNYIILHGKRVTSLFAKVLTFLTTMRTWLNLKFYKFCAFLMVIFKDLSAGILENNSKTWVTLIVPPELLEVKQVVSIMFVLSNVVIYSIVKFLI